MYAFPAVPTNITGYFVQQNRFRKLCITDYMRSLLLIGFLALLQVSCAQMTAMDHDRYVGDDMTIPPMITKSYTLADDMLKLEFERESKSSVTSIALYLPYNGLDSLYQLNEEQIKVNYHHVEGVLEYFSYQVDFIDLTLHTVNNEIIVNGNLGLILEDNISKADKKEIHLGFRLQNEDELIDCDYELSVPCVDTQEEISQFPDLQAEYPGGPEAMMKFISENIQYPPDAKEMCVQGKVFVSLIIERDGSLSRVAVIRGVHSSLDKEALRVIRAMPNWIPAEVRGKNVRSKVYIPISFTRM